MVTRYQILSFRSGLDDLSDRLGPRCVRQGRFYCVFPLNRQKISRINREGKYIDQYLVICRYPRIRHLGTVGHLVRRAERIKLNSFHGSPVRMGVPGFSTLVGRTLIALRESATPSCC